MKALTLKHPWPFCIARCGKDVENRTWRPPASLVGEYFVIHGGKVPKDIDDLEDIWDEAREWAIEAGLGLEVTRGDALMTGLVAVVRLAGVVTTCKSKWFEGPVGWCLADLFVLPRPIPCKGAQGLWEVPPEMVEDIRRQWRESRTVSSAPRLPPLSADRPCHLRQP